MQEYSGQQTRPYQEGVCWVCNAPADSREHRLKKSDLISKFGKGAFIEKVIHVVGGQEKEVQGPDAKRLKYPQSLCSRCNNMVTQPFDRAYEQLMSWVFANEESILQTRSIDLRAVYGKECREAVGNLIRYFAKSLGCRINDVKRPVPTALSKAASGGAIPASLQLSFCVLDDLAKIRESCSTLIGKADMYGNSDPDAPPYYSWNEYVCWFFTMYSYGQHDDRFLGTTLSETTEVIYLGSLPVLSAEERLEVGTHADSSMDEPAQS